MKYGTFHGLPSAAAMVLGLALALFAGPAAAEQIILYDHRDFDGQSVTLNQSTPDLGNFDNEASSVRIISGTWVLYRNANYGVTPSRPSLTLGPGDYPNLDNVGFPRNKLSSVELLAGEAPPPPPPPPTPQPTPLPQACAADNVVSAGRGCRGCYPGTVAGPDNSRCVCPPGQPVIGRRANGDDRCGQPGGQPDQGDEQQAFCPGGDQISYRQGCLTCPENTVPNASNSRCVCAPGMINQGIDSRGQDLCILPSGSIEQSRSGGGSAEPAMQTVEVQAGNAWYVAHVTNAPGDSNPSGFSAGRIQARSWPGETCTVSRAVLPGGRQVIVLYAAASGLPGTPRCEWVIFRGYIDLAWTLSFSPPRRVGGNCLEETLGPGFGPATVTRVPPGDIDWPAYLVSFSVAPGPGNCTMHIDTITFTGPADGKWEDAFD